MKPDTAIPLAILAVSIGSLATAFTAQYGFDLQPCILCLYQRVPFYANGLIAISMLTFASTLARPSVIALCGVIFGIGGGIAAYHVGVEQHWWASATGCNGGLPTDMTLDQMKASLMSKRVKPCDEVDWTLFGISIATYNVLYSSGLGAVTLFAAKWLRDRSDAR